MDVSNTWSPNYRWSNNDREPALFVKTSTVKKKKETVALNDQKSMNNMKQ